MFVCTYVFAHVHLYIYTSFVPSKMRFQLLGILRRVVAQPMVDATSELSCAYDVLSVLNSFVLEAKVPQSQRAQGVAKLKQMAQKYDSIYEI